MRRHLLIWALVVVVLGLARPAAQASPSATAYTLLMLPAGASGGSAQDRIWRYANGSWAGLIPPAAGKYWLWLAADPFNANRWLLLGNSSNTAGSTYFRVINNRVLMNDGLTAPLWLTTNSGQSWTAVNLTVPNIWQRVEQLKRVEWSNKTSGQWAMIGNCMTTIGYFCAWRGVLQTPSFMVDGNFLVSDVLSLSDVGLNDELIFHTDYATGYLGSAATSATRVGDEPDLRSGIFEVLPGTSRTLVAVGQNNGDFLVTTNYMTNLPTRKLSAIGRQVTATKTATFVGGNPRLLRLTNVTSTPSSTAITPVLPTGISIGFVRADRQTRTVVAARILSSTNTNDERDNYVYDGTQLTRITGPSQAAASLLADQLEIILPGNVGPSNGFKAFLPLVRR